jgi:hypothetical protein
VLRTPDHECLGEWVNWDCRVVHQPGGSRGLSEKKSFHNLKLLTKRGGQCQGGGAVDEAMVALVSNHLLFMICFNGLWILPWHVYCCNMLLDFLHLTVAKFHV